MVKCYGAMTDTTIDIELVLTEQFDAWFEEQDGRTQNWVSGHQFVAKSGQVLRLSNAEGHVEKVLLGLADEEDLLEVGALPKILVTGHYRLVANLSPDQLELATVAWGMGAYRFSRYKQGTEITASLCIDPSLEAAHIQQTVEAIYLVRDLVNTPAEDMGPEELAEAAKKLASEFKASFKQIVGKKLIAANYPSIHAVGRAATQEPRLIDIRWGDKSHPKVTLVGKGVCFDTGGLDLKNPSGMLYMRKDMAGAAHVLALGKMIMAAKLPVCLRILIPAVENAVSGNAYRPGDIITSRKGLTVEIINTDAEGRVVLSDALAEASTEKPDLLIDMATLTSAARVALGTEISAIFSDDDDLVRELESSALKTQDLVWRLPMHRSFLKSFKSNVADIANAATTPFAAGASVAALFLKQFVDDDIAWLHVDMMAWNKSSSAAKPEGAEACGIRALFDMIRRKYA